MDTRAPAVVAVLVTRDPGPYFDEVLESLAAQNYEELSVLVIVSGGTDDPTERVAAVLPEAFVRRLDTDRGFGAGVNEALGMVEGAAFFLLCHDDCAPNPDAIHVLVEESYRSNAGVVAPKMVRWDDPSILLHVGLSADKTGAVVDRVQPGEVDHGQHDGVRDIFVAPGGFTLIRADLFEELGGYDAGILAMGEDLDLCWRAQVAGARVIVAPDAVVRHLQVRAGGERTVADPGTEAPLPSLQALQRRHELRAMLKCYGLFHLLRVLPQAVLLATGESLVALVARDRDRASAVVGAWRWNFANRGELRELRKAVDTHRRYPDKEVRRLQLRGSARLTTYFSRLTHQGFDVASGLSPSTLDVASVEAEPEPVLTGSVGISFSEDADFDELDDLGRRAGRNRFGQRVRRPFFSTRRSRLSLWALVIVIVLFGSRELVGNALPLIGQFAPLPSWGGTWHHFVSGWQPTGLGSTAPATPAFGLLGALGTVLFGAMGFTQKVLVLGCIPLGVAGVVRLVRPICSPRARLAAGGAYLGLPLAYNAIATGRLDGLVTYALLPWMLLRLARASELAPYTSTRTDWRGTLLGQAVILGVLDAVGLAFAPAMVPVLLLCALGIVVGSGIVGERQGSWRVLAVGLGATVMALVLCFPFVIGAVASGTQVSSVFGLPLASSDTASWTALLRFALGPLGSSPLTWLLVFAALLPIFIGRRERLAWAGRLWSVACLSWLLALASARGWLGAFTPSLPVVIVPAGIAVAAAIGIGIAAFEEDLSGYRFGWRQSASVVAVLATVAGVLPVVAKSLDGRWGMPPTGYEAATTFMSTPAKQSSFRVLWLGDPRAMPLGGWSLAPGVEYATSDTGAPNGVDTWAPAAPGPADLLGHAVVLAEDNQTTHLGRLLAPASVRYVVLVEALSPSVTGGAPTGSFATPPKLLATLLAQGDLQPIPAGAGVAVFANTDYIPERAERPTTAITANAPTGALASPTQGDVTGWRPVMPAKGGALSYRGPLERGTVYAAYAPAGRWQLTVDGHTVGGAPAFGWAQQFDSSAAGNAVIGFKGTPLQPLGIAVELALWLLVAVALLDRRRRSLEGVPLVSRARGAFNRLRPGPPPPPPVRPPPQPRHAAAPKVGG